MGIIIGRSWTWPKREQLDDMTNKWCRINTLCQLVASTKECEFWEIFDWVFDESLERRFFQWILEGLMSITSHYEQMRQAVSLLDYQQWKNWLKMTVYGLKQVCNRLSFSDSSPWTNFTLHCVKHFVNNSLVITHLPDVITWQIFEEEVRSNHWRYWEKMRGFQKCSMILVLAL